jgi:flavodoxin
MNNLVIFFSLLGHNGELAQEIADREKSDVLEFAPGSIFRVFQFFSGKKKLAKKAKKLNIEVQNYQEIAICGPIWGGKPAPAVMILLQNMDMKGKKVSCYYTYTQDYGNTEETTRKIIQTNLGEVKEIKFANISKKRSDK